LVLESARSRIKPRCTVRSLASREICLRFALCVERTHTAIAAVQQNATPENVETAISRSMHLIERVLEIAHLNSNLLQSSQITLSKPCSSANC
jgi:hypothetical protein